MFGRILVVALAVALLVSVVARSGQGAGPERRYVVKPADTLWAIALRDYGGDPREAVWEIRERNGLTGTTVQPGQVLVLPAG
ncbi:MAG TPA: LysM peptidoglycan-binding domain-containing protein [Gaiellaceae bacterium]|nr:LysM peptidoglycan-binding domain-containing protein [Gaiellaceae bacterium]